MIWHFWLYGGGCWIFAALSAWAGAEPFTLAIVGASWSAFGLVSWLRDYRTRVTAAGRRYRIPLGLAWHICVEFPLQRFRAGARWAAPVRWLGRVLYRGRRRIQGARSVDTADRSNGEVRGCVGEIEVEIGFGGHCPVQGEGRICLGLRSEGCRTFEDWREVYYRSRGEGWEFCVAGPSGDVFDDDAWCYSENRYFWPDGGWVSARVSEACIRKAVALYASSLNT